MEGIACVVIGKRLVSTLPTVCELRYSHGKGSALGYGIL
jgi:hypothetical protein